MIVDRKIGVAQQLLHAELGCLVPASLSVIHCESVGCVASISGPACLLRLPSVRRLPATSDNVIITDGGGMQLGELGRQSDCLSRGEDGLALRRVIVNRDHSSHLPSLTPQTLRLSSQCVYNNNPITSHHVLVNSTCLWLARSVRDPRV